MATPISERMPDSIPYIAHEGEVTRLCSIIKRMWVIIIMLILLLVGTNLCWLRYEAQFEDEVVTQTVQQDAENGTNNFVGGDYNGEADGDDHNQNPEA